MIWPQPGWRPGSHRAVTPGCKPVADLHEERRAFAGAIRRALQTAPGGADGVTSSAQQALPKQRGCRALSHAGFPQSVVAQFGCGRLMATGFAAGLAAGLVAGSQPVYSRSGRGFHRLGRWFAAGLQLIYWHCGCGFSPRLASSVADRLCRRLGGGLRGCGFATAGSGRRFVTGLPPGLIPVFRGQWFSPKRAYRRFRCGTHVGFIAGFCRRGFRRRPRRFRQQACSWPQALACHGFQSQVTPPSGLVAELPALWSPSLIAALLPPCRSPLRQLDIFPGIVTFEADRLQALRPPVGSGIQRPLPGR